MQSQEIAITYRCGHSTTIKAALAVKPNKITEIRRDYEAKTCPTCLRRLAKQGHGVGEA